MKLLAIKKNDKYYCRENDKYPNNIPDQERLRFDVPRLPSFNDKWVVFNELPTCAERCIVGKLRIFDYQLKDGFSITTETPSILPVGSFDCMQWNCDDDCIEWKNRDIKGLYEANEMRDPDIWKPIEFDVDLIDEDVVKHKYPCYMDGEELYRLIRIAVKANLPDHCVITSDYNFSLTVKIRAPVLHEETFRVDVSSMNARKPKMVDKRLKKVYNMTEYERDMEELRIAGMFDKDSDYDGDIGRCVEELLNVFKSQGHSGFSAARTAEVFATLVDGKVLIPLKGTSNEWMDVSEYSGTPTFQNKRCSQVFAKTKYGDGAYDINYFIFVDKNGTTFTRGDRSSIPISFPYMPRSRFVKARYSWIVSKVEKIKYALRQYY